MTHVGFNVGVHDIFSIGPEGLDDFFRLRAGVEPVGCKADDQKIGHHVGEGVVQGTVVFLQIEIIDRLGDIQIGIGVKAVDELGSLVVQIGFDHEDVLEAGDREVFILESPPEFFMHVFFAEIGYMTDHAGQGEARIRAF